MSKSEIEVVAEELRARLDFDCVAGQLSDWIISQPPGDISTVVDAWVRLLKQQSVSLHAAALTLSGPGNLHILAAAESRQGFWRELIGLPFVSRLVGCVQEKKMWASVLPQDPRWTQESGAMLLAFPCPGSKPLITMATVARHNSQIQLLRWMTDAAARHAGTMMALFRAGQESERERERGYRELASRMAHVVSNSVCVAELRLRSLQEKGVRDVNIKDSISQVIETLGDAQRGLTRARLLDLPWDCYGEEVSLVEFMQERSRELNEAVAPRVAVETDDFGDERPSVYAAPERLRYAFRDLLLGVWLLGGKRRPVKLILHDRQDRVEIHIEGDVTEQVGGIPSKLILDHFFDPATFLSSDQEPSEYGVSFHFARQLIKEIEGSDVAMAGNDQVLLQSVRLVVTLVKDGGRASELRTAAANGTTETP
jgi:signal transduction histidine kinase